MTSEEAPQRAGVVERLPVVVAAVLDSSTGVCFTEQQS